MSQKRLPKWCQHTKKKKKKKKENKKKKKKKKRKQKKKKTLKLLSSYLYISNHRILFKFHAASNNAASNTHQIMCGETLDFPMSALVGLMVR